MRHESEISSYVSAVEQIYSAATDPDRWSNVTNHLCNSLAASGGCLIRHDCSTAKGEMRSIAGMPDDSGQAYTGIAYANLFAQRAGDQRAGTCMVDRELVSRSELMRTDLYTDFLRQRDIHSILSVFLRSHGGMRIAFGRPHSGGEWEKYHVKFLTALAPHLCRVAEVNARLEGLQLGLSWEPGLVDSLIGGLVSVDSSGEILQANAAGERILRKGDGLVSRNGRLAGLLPADTIALRATIATTARQTPDHNTGGTLAVKRSTDEDRYRVIVVPVGFQSSFFADRRPAALVCIQDPGIEEAILKARLQSSFALTPAEAALSIALASTAGVQTAARQCKMAISTARKHLQHVFEKTNTHRQAELVRLVLAVKDEPSLKAQPIQD